MWKPENRVQYEEIVADLLADPLVMSMEDLPQHSCCSNCLDHSIYVSYLSFLICRRLGLDYVAAARAGLLHDFYLCKWEETDHGFRRFWRHPSIALENANARYELSKLEEDIIEKHMWPLTPRPPRFLESFIVSCADKFCAALEMSRLYKAMKVKHRLRPVEVAA